MTEKDLISKLNNLKNINPSEAWLKSNRELLLSQVSNSGATELSAWKNFVINLSSLTKASAQPVYAFGIFVFALLATGVFSHQLFSSAKPNDTLYIARIISEKAKLSTVINTESRDKLAMQFANERAQEISAVLADPSFNNDNNKDAVAKLNTDFNEEIETVKTKIKSLSPAKNNVAAVSAPTINNDSVLIAENNKDASGVQLFDATAKVNETAATLTLAVKATTTPEEIKKDSSSTENILDEAQKLFEKKDYGQASDKLKEVKEIMK
jgi:hypothetical protein